MEWQRCPRCEAEAYEKLETYAHCVECLYSPEFEIEDAVPKWAIAAANMAKTLAHGRRRGPAVDHRVVPTHQPELALAI